MTTNTETKPNPFWPDTLPLPAAESPRNWTEDYSHENGRYHCLCCKCQNGFIGHKRRVVCKECNDRLLLEKIVETSVRYVAFSLELSEAEFVACIARGAAGEIGLRADSMIEGISRITGASLADIHNQVLKSA
jgi:DNA-directed RNA polymerase subunit RPC12/RpoP